MFLYVPQDFSKSTRIRVEAKQITPAPRGYLEYVVEVDSDMSASDVYRSACGRSARLADVERGLRVAMLFEEQQKLKRLEMPTLMPFAWFDEAQDDLERLPLRAREQLRRCHLRQYFRIALLIRARAKGPVRALTAMRHAVLFSRAHPTSQSERVRTRRPPVARRLSPVR